MKFLLLSGAMLLTLASAVQAQVAWETPMNSGSISGNYTGNDTDISTAGTFIAAVSECNIGGVTYPITVSDRDTSFDEGSDSFITGMSTGGTDGSGSATPNYHLALDGCTYQYTNSGSFTFNLTGLNAGDEYQVEIWNVVNDPTRDTEYSSTGTDGTTSVDVENGFVLGTFSGETSQSIIVQGIVVGGVGEVNAVALRDLGAIPEPSTYAMFFGGLVMLVLVSRVRRKLIA